MPNPKAAVMRSSTVARDRQYCARSGRDTLTTSSQSLLDRSAGRPPLPLYVEPSLDEALLSWLLRLATLLGVSFHVLARQAFGIDDRSGYTRWWNRPHPWALVRISERTGVNVARLRQMTFEGLEPAYRDDEAAAHFAGRRYDSRAAERPAYRLNI
jgi:hypothetical protein